MSEPSTNPDAVVITGASTGIGRTAALHLAGKGLRVLTGVRKASDGEAVAKAFAAEKHAGSGSIEPLVIDVADGDSIARAVAEVGERLGGSRLAGLVNNAGIALGGPQEHLALSEWRRQFEVNVFGLVDLTQRLLPHLLAGRGRVVNISSMGGKVSTPFMAPYSASKFAVEAITDALRMELAPFGVWAACVEPGAVKTEIWKKADELMVERKTELPAEVQQRYAELMTAMAKFTATAAKNGVDAIKVARAIEHALLARRPRTRYPVGPDARMGMFLHWLLPDRMFEWLLRKAM
jgi:NAD(P)-dependent dehydrogenase (short-subunit alcohol dehydrogenase family)